MKTALSAAIPPLAYGLALWPQGNWYLARTRDHSDEPLGILALATVVLMAWSQRRRLTGYYHWGWVILVLTGAASFVLPPLLTAALGLLAIALATGLFRHPGLSGLLLLSLPVMASCQFYLGYPLRLGVTLGSQAILNSLGYSVERAGTLLLYQNREVGVDPPCAGLHMLWFTGYLLCTLAALHHISCQKFLPLIPLALILSVGANILRATLLFFPESQLIHLPSSSHQAIGLLLHLAMAGLLSLLITRTQNQTPTYYQCSIKHPSSCSAPVSA